MEQQLQYNIDSEGKVTVSRLITNMCTGKQLYNVYNVYNVHRSTCIGYEIVSL